MSFGDNMKLQLTKFVEERLRENPEVTAKEQLQSLLDYGGWSARRPTVEVDESEQCEGRRWLGWNDVKGKEVSGVGSRCRRARTDNGCFCKKHQAQADVTCSPCQFWTDTDTLPPKTKVGDKKGLFYGRFDEALPYSDGTHIVTIWADDEVLEKITADMKDGMTYHPFTKEGKANKTAPPRIPGTKKAPKAKKTKTTKTTKTKRSTTARRRWMADGNRKKVRNAIEGLFKETGKFPPSTQKLLMKHNLDVDAASAEFKDYTTTEWKTFCNDNSFANDRWEVDELGNMAPDVKTGKPAELKYGAIMGEIQKMLSSIWKNLPQAEKQPYIDLEEADDKLLAEADDEAPTSPKADTKKEKKRAKKQAKKAKKAALIAAAAAAAAAAASESEDSDSDSESDEGLSCIKFTMASGEVVLLDPTTYMSYTEDGDELGQINKETKNFC